MREMDKLLEDLVVDVYNRGVDNMVRVTHRPTGKWEECGKYKGIVKNRTEAISKLMERLG